MLAVQKLLEEEEKKKKKRLILRAGTPATVIRFWGLLPWMDLPSAPD